jgi:hypothetical protein
MAGFLKNVLGGDGSNLVPVARKLISLWSTDFAGIWSASEIPQEDLKRGLLFLVRIGKIGKDVLNPALPLAKRVEAALAGIKDFQAKVGLDEDHILGRKTLGVINANLNCPGRDDSDQEALSPTSIAKVANSVFDKYHLIFYCVDSSVPEKIHDSRTLDLIADAWDMWIVHERKILIRRVDERENANVLIESKRIDGPFGTLGVAHVGGPIFRTRLLCTLDDDEEWNPLKFRAAACHEFGHLLGLRHTEAAKQLMNPYLSVQMDITEPQSGDISELQRIWA